MIVALALALQLASPPPVREVSPAPPPSRLDECMAAAAADPETGIALANGWLAEGAGIEPRFCLGVALVQDGNPAAALPPLLGAAADADSARSPRRGEIWSFAGVAALHTGDFAAARRHFDRAISAGTLSNVALGSTLSLRARAAVALDDAPAARTDLDRALTLAPDNGGTWLLSATLARRMRDYGRAQADIQQAAALLPREPAVALEAGNIAFMADNFAAARRSWESVIAIAPDSDAAATARAQLAELQAEEGEQPAVVAPVTPRRDGPSR